MNDFVTNTFRRSLSKGWLLRNFVFGLVCFSWATSLSAQGSYFSASYSEPGWATLEAFNPAGNTPLMVEPSPKISALSKPKTTNLGSIRTPKESSLDKDFLHDSNANTKAKSNREKKSIAIGGYAKLDFINDFQSAETSTNGEHFNLYALIPLEGSLAEHQSNSVLTARESRLFVDTSTPTEFGDFKTKFEGDFFGANASEKLVASFGFRLRRAFGDFRGFRAGQDFSTFMDPKALPETLTLSGPVGFTFLMQGVLRYTHEFSTGTLFSVAVENPYSDYAPAWTDFSRSDRVPDFHLAIERQRHNGHIRVRSFLRTGTALNDTTGAMLNSQGWGLGLCGKSEWNERTEFRYDLKYGNGLGRYIFEGGLGDQGWSFDGVNLSPVPATGGYVNLRHRFAKQWRGNLIYGFAQFDNSPLVAGSTNRNIQSYHCNLLYTPIESVTAGLEFSFAKREVEDGRKGRRNRLQFSIKYAF